MEKLKLKYNMAYLNYILIIFQLLKKKIKYLDSTAFDGSPVTRQETPTQKKMKTNVCFIINCPDTFFGIFPC